MAPDPSLTPESIHARAFTVGFRGYDQSEVRDFLNRLAAEIRSLREQAERFESQWHSAEERAARPPVLDEETLMAAVGEETAAILRTARASAADLRNKAAEDADRIRLESEGLLGEKTKEAEEAAAAIVDEARTEAERILERVRAEAEQIRAKADQDRTLTIEGANATREKILEDLSRRRRVATVQIEQLRAGRERLLESYAVVRRTLEEAQEELTKADAEARAAADEVGRKLNRETEHSPAAAPGNATQGGSGGSGAAAIAAAVEHPAAGGATEPEEDHDPVPHLRVVPDLETASEEPGAGGVAGEVAVLEVAVVEAAAEMASGGDKSPVDQLFAKIRAGSGSRERAASTGAADEDRSEASSDAPAGAQATTAEASTEAAQRGDETWLQKREQAMGNLDVSLTRKLKRALQDEQNDLLDRLRGLRSEVTADALLPAADSHRERYAKAAMPLINQAATAGAQFAAAVSGSKSGDAPDVISVAGEAADAIVAPLRRRLEQAIGAGASEDQAVLIESIGAAYREWKSQRIERVAGDALSAAFARGTWHAVPDGARMRWIADDIDGPCPDCDDDALAGELPKGEPFPTGQAHPPAHTGCRCLLVPVTG
ncbi:MAG TPA: DivIVA domain-containing protein [Acidimicrobiales bacterium]|nr:DivIVA domain-containing protein [Acidimicrobiales bacterium]